MCTAGQRVSLTITGPGPSLFDTNLFFLIRRVGWPTRVGVGSGSV